MSDILACAMVNSQQEDDLGAKSHVKGAAWELSCAKFLSEVSKSEVIRAGKSAQASWRSGSVAYPDVHTKGSDVWLYTNSDGKQLRVWVECKAATVVDIKAATKQMVRDIQGKDVDLMLLLAKETDPRLFYYTEKGRTPVRTFALVFMSPREASEGEVEDFESSARNRIVVAHMNESNQMFHWSGDKHGIACPLSSIHLGLGCFFSQGVGQ